MSKGRRSISVPSLVGDPGVPEPMQEASPAFAARWGTHCVSCSCLTCSLCVSNEGGCHSQNDRSDALDGRRILCASHRGEPESEELIEMLRTPATA